MTAVHPLAGYRPNSSHLRTAAQERALFFHQLAFSSPIAQGTSGQRDRAPKFNQLTAAALTQGAIDVRLRDGHFGPALSANLQLTFAPDPSKLGPVIIGKDVRFGSDFTEDVAITVFTGNGQKVIISNGRRATPTPNVSHAILQRNTQGQNVEGVIITASHNDPGYNFDDGTQLPGYIGYKTNGQDGGPNTNTKPIDAAANNYLDHPERIKYMSYEQALAEGLIEETDLMTPYVKDLANVVDMNLIRQGKFAVSPLGGSAGGYYTAINGIHGTNITEIFGEPDPAGEYSTFDYDGVLRGDPSSIYAMMTLKGMREQHGVPFVGANDRDADRFGGEDSTGILKPNHVLCVLFNYLAKTRSFNQSMGIGRTIGTTHMLDLIAAKHNRPVHEVNVGFKYYVKGLLEGRYVLAGEESAGLVIPRFDGSVWVTEKDGILANLLMMEIMAATGKDIGTLYAELVAEFGPHQYDRIDSHATDAKKARLKVLTADPNLVKSLLEGKKIAGRNIERMVIGDGIKVVLEGGVWVLFRASGTEPIIKDYREERGETLGTAAKASEELQHYLGLLG